MLLLLLLLLFLLSLLLLLLLLLLSECFLLDVLFVIEVAEEADKDDVGASSDVDGDRVANAVEARLDVEPGSDEDKAEVELDDLCCGHVPLPGHGDLQVSHQVVVVHQDMDERVQEHHPWERKKLVVKPHPSHNEHNFKKINK